VVCLKLLTSLRADGSRECAPDDRLCEGNFHHMSRSSYPRKRVSSTPRPLGLIAAGSGILDRPIKCTARG
jgi:hypothetical protein